MVSQDDDADVFVWIYRLCTDFHALNFIVVADVLNFEAPHPIAALLIDSPDLLTCIGTGDRLLMVVATAQ